MRALMLLMALLIANVLPAPSALAQAAPRGASVRCPHTDGLIDGPYVADERIARRIATAVIERTESADFRRRYDLAAAADCR